CSGAGYTIVQKNATVYTIRVTPGLDLGPDIPICGIGTQPEQLFAHGGENLKLQWEELVDQVKMPQPQYLSDPTIQDPISHPDETKVKSSVTYTIFTPDLLGSSCRS